MPILDREGASMGHPVDPRPARAIAMAAPLGWDAAAIAWPALCALVAVASVVPLWAGRFLPFQDAPQHLAAIRVLADYASPPFGFERFFEIDLARSQYLGFYLPAALLARLFGPEAACRIVLSLVALVLPAAAWTFLRSFDRDARLAVLAPALFHTAPLYLGFFNFVESVPATLLVIALAERELRSPRTGRAVALAVLAAGLLYLHPSALALALGSAVLLAATAGSGWPRALRPIAPFPPGLAGLAAWMAASLFPPAPDAGWQAVSALRPPSRPG